MMLSGIWRALRHQGHTRDDGFNLRAWFGFFLAFLVGLAALTLVALRYDNAAAFWPQRLWLLALCLFYMSLCCTLFPAPTAWIILLMASPVLELIPPTLLAERWGLGSAAATVTAGVLTVALVATVGALGTALANLNEYHIFTYLLRMGRVGRVRQARLYHWASRYFVVTPFWLLVLASFLPIPVDLVRWLAISHRYGRLRFAAATFLGRFPRYAILAATAFSLSLGFWGIAVIQAILLAPVVIGWAALKRRHVTCEVDLSCGDRGDIIS